MESTAAVGCPAALLGLLLAVTSRRPGGFGSRRPVNKRTRGLRRNKNMNMNKKQHKQHQQHQQHQQQQQQHQHQHQHHALPRPPRTRHAIAAWQRDPLQARGGDGGGLSGGGAPSRAPARGVCTAQTNSWPPHHLQRTRPSWTRTTHLHLPHAPSPAHTASTFSSCPQPPPAPSYNLPRAVHACTCPVTLTLTLTLILTPTLTPNQVRSTSQQLAPPPTCRSLSAPGKYASM